MLNPFPLRHQSYAHAEPSSPLRPRSSSASASSSAYQRPQSSATLSYAESSSTPALTLSENDLMPGLNLDISSTTLAIKPTGPPRGGAGTVKTRQRENTFSEKHGRKHHTFDPEKAPYPMSYDRHFLELQHLDRIMVSHLKHSISFVDFKDGLPECSLDLGCGTGGWVIDAAKEWPDCHFVGFDLVNVQIPLAFLDKRIAERITWIHGNFLTTKLPFDDDEFDHVHISAIARGVPETKWNLLFGEINRVLRPGGAVEIGEHDIIFPTLPRWFSSPLRVRSRRAGSVHLPDGSREPNSDSANGRPSPPHDHALLESLFYAIFENRFISLRPTAVLPIYFTPYFGQVLSSPVINFPMPPLPPLPPLPQQMIPPDPLTAALEASDAYVLNNSSRSRSDSNNSTISTNSDLQSLKAGTTSPSLLSTLSASTAGSATDSTEDSLFSEPDDAVAGASLKTSLDVSDIPLLSRPSSHTEETTPKPSPLPTPCLPDCTPLPSPARVLSPVSEAERSRSNSTPTPHVHRIMEGNRTDESTSIGFSPAQSLLPMEAMTALSERSLAMHLYYAYQSVLACQESMWEELKDRLINKKEELEAFGWDDDEELEGLKSSRMKFDKLIERYRTDMQARVSLWCSLADLGWPIPTREPLSKAELIEEERVHQAVLEARKHATEEDLETLSRSMRIIVGFKS